jgi:hypothetical protein
METGIRTLTSGDLANVGNAATDDVGAVGQTADGRLYRYVKAGGAVAGGSLVVSAGTVANHLNAAVAAAAAAGVTQVSVTLGATAATQDQYAGGFLVVGTDGSGVAITRRIKGNTAGASAGTITVVLDSKEPLLFALTTSNKVSLIPARENGVVASSTTGDPVGITVNSLASGQYGWVQTYGPCAVTNDAAGALTALSKVAQSGTVAGAVVAVAATAATTLSIGYMLQAAAASKSGLAQLQIN